MLSVNQRGARALNDDHLKGIINRNGAPKEEEDTGRPDLQGPYQAFGRPCTKYLSSLLVYFNAEGRKLYRREKIQLQYRDIESDNPLLAGLDDDGGGFAVILAGQVSKQRLIVRGRNLDQRGPDRISLFDFISFHRMPWIRAADRDFAEDGEPIITSITLEEIKFDENGQIVKPKG